MKKRRVALFTPLPPARTGTADYGAALAKELEKLVSLTVYEEKPLAFFPERFDDLVYQIGNNFFHCDIYKTALEHPGVIVLHEATVHNLVLSMTIYRGSHNRYRREALYEIFGRDVNLFAMRYMPVEAQQPNELLMLRRILNNSRACIVHSHFAERLVRLNGFRGPLQVIPHGVSLHSPDTQKYRQALGIDPETPLVGIFGYQRPDKQIWDCLGMFRELVDSLPEARLLVLGQQSPQVPLKDRIRDLRLEKHVFVMGYQTLDDFDGYLAACTAVLNLRRNTLGETSGTMMRAFSFGRPVIVSDAGSSSELSDDICVKIPHDRHELKVSIECLKWLLSNPGEAKEMGERARQWVAAECTWDKVAQRYVSFLGASSRRAVRKTGSSGSGDAEANGEEPDLTEDALLEYLARWIAPDDATRSDYFGVHSVRLARTLQLTPPGDRDRRILELGCYMQITPALSGLLGYGEVKGAYYGRLGRQERTSVTARDGEEFSCTVDVFDCEVDRFPYPDNTFDTIVCCELLEHLQTDPMHMMCEINRVLKPYGVLVLSTPNAVSLRAFHSLIFGAHPGLFSHYGIPTLSTAPRHAREYTPKELIRLFSDSGFSIQHLETTPYGERPGIYKWITKAIRLMRPLIPLREDCVHIVGQKTTAVRTRYPAWLYIHD